MRFLLPAALLLLPLYLGAQETSPEPVIDVYVSTGDNHFLGSSLPIDSPASIEATFDLFRDVQHARRVYWRGHEASCWLRTMHARPENPRSYSFWTWLNKLYETVHPDQLAVKAAHERGMEIWGMGTLWDWGSPADTPAFTDYPFCYESKLKLEHPEWAPVDKHGVRVQGGPIELAYPEARKALVEMTVQETLAAGYDGLALLTYVENFSQRFQDEFGYSDPIVDDFKAKYKIDIRSEPFRRGASREDWLRLRGSYITSFLRELKTELVKHDVKLGMVVNSNESRLPQSWNVPDLMMTAGSHHMDVDTWIRESIVDELLIYGNNSGQSQIKVLEDLRFLARDTDTSISVITSGPFREAWQPYQPEGLPIILAVSDDTQHLERGFIPEQTADALSSAELPIRMRALQQVITDELEADVKNITPLLSSDNLIERRLALHALGILKDASVVPLIEKALDDPENGVRCVAALTLSKLNGPESAAALFAALEKHDNHMLRECSIIALRRLNPFPVDEISAAALQSPNDHIREAAMRALVTQGNSKILPTLKSGLDDKARFPRFAAAEALGNIRKSTEAVDILIEALQHNDPVVINRAATSLGQIAVRNEKEIADIRSNILAALLAAFQRHSDDVLADAEWGWRPIGNAILDLGDEGAEALRKIRDHSDNPRLAELAWRVVDLTQRSNTFSEVTPEQNQAAHALRPGPAAASTTDIYVDPDKGDDTKDGRSQDNAVKRIAQAIRIATPGDTIHLAPTTYYESAVFIDKHGEPGKPIILDGHGAILEGSEPVTAAEWEKVPDTADLYRRSKLYPRTDDAIVARWFLLFDGKMQRMNRCSKGPSEPLKEIADLQPGEWTYVKAEDAFYLKLKPGQDLDKANIRYPARSSSVIFASTGSNIIVRNLTGTHPYNDGYNIHGAQYDLVFENIKAIECGDDGFSAHEDATCTINGFTSIDNATGFCDTGTSQTDYRHVYIKDCHGFDLYFIGQRHSIENARIESSAARPFWVDGNLLTDGRQCVVTMKNVLLRRADKIDAPREMRVGNNGRLQATNCTFQDLNIMITPTGSVDFRQCHIGANGEQKPEVLLFKNTTWRGDGNVYDFKNLRADQTWFKADAFEEFQKFTGSEKTSQWSTTEPPETIGADLTTLPSPE